MLKTLGIFGRDEEQQELDEIVSSYGSKIIVVYGRRRVGKTTLIRQVLKERKFFKFEGIEDQNEEYQRESFIDELSVQIGDKKISKIKTKNWRETLSLLNEYVLDEEIVIYLEEIQWLA